MLDSAETDWVDGARLIGRRMAKVLPWEGLEMTDMDNHEVCHIQCNVRIYICVYMYGACMYYTGVNANRHRPTPCVDKVDP